MSAKKSGIPRSMKASAQPVLDASFGYTLKPRVSAPISHIPQLPHKPRWIQEQRSIAKRSEIPTMPRAPKPIYRPTAPKDRATQRAIALTRLEGRMSEPIWSDTPVPESIAIHAKRWEKEEASGAAEAKRQMVDAAREQHRLKLREQAAERARRREKKRRQQQLEAHVARHQKKDPWWLCLFCIG